MKELSRLEEEVMSLIWDLGECSSAEVIEAFRSNRDLADTTIRTVISNLRKKQYIELVPSIDRGHRFKPCVDREGVAGRSLSRVVSTLFSGSSQMAIMHLIKEGRLNDEELDEIRRILNQDPQDKKNRND